MKTLIRIFLCVSLLYFPANFIMGDDYSKVSGFDSWRYINPMDVEEYVRQQRELISSGVAYSVSAMYTPQNEKHLKKIAEILKISKKENTSSFIQGYLQKLCVNEGGIHGYRNQKIDIDTISGTSRSSLNSIWVVPEQWSVLIDISSVFKNGQNKLAPDIGNIRSYIVICNDFDHATTELVQMIVCGNMEARRYLQMYKIDKGPGDVCLVGAFATSSLDEKFVPLPQSLEGIDLTINGIGDKKVAFIRNNVAVYLSTYYKDFGCMDLACRLDALIVEQIKKQQAKKQQKQEE